MKIISQISICLTIFMTHFSLVWAWAGQRVAWVTSLDDKAGLAELKWEGNAAQVLRDSENGPPNAKAILRGTYRRKGWAIFIWDQQIAVSGDGRFQLELALSGKDNSVEIYGVGPKGEIETQKFGIHYPGWGVRDGEVFRAELSPVFATIAGTLAPLRVAINGHLVVKQDLPVMQLLLNGSKLEPKSSQHFPFFTTSGADVLKVIAKLSNASTEEVAEISLPRVLRAEVTGQEVQLSISSDVISGSVDGKEFPIKEGKLIYPLSSAEIKEGEKRIVEIKAKALSRVYTINFTSKPR